MPQYEMPRTMIRQYADALDAWVTSMAYNAQGDIDRARACAKDASERFDYLAQAFPLPGTTDPNPDAVIAQYGIRAYMGTSTAIPTADLEALVRNAAYINTLYESGSKEYRTRHQGGSVDRPYAQFGWEPTGGRWPLVDGDDARAALALRYIETQDFAAAEKVLGRFDSNLSPALSSAHMLLLSEAGQWHRLITVAGVVVNRFQHERTRLLAQGDPDVLIHQVKVETWYLAMYLMALGNASLGQFSTAEPMFNEVERVEGLPSLVALSAFHHAQALQAEGRSARATEMLSQSLRINPTQRAQSAMGSGILPLRVTSKDLIDARTDPWDPETEPDPETERRRKVKSERTKMLEEAKAKLRDIVGLAGLKLEMEELGYVIAEEGVKRARGIASKGSNFNALLLGHPGTGKTTITEYMALQFCANGLINDPTPVILMKPDLIGSVVGSAPEKTDEQLTRNTGRYILFDEAYALATNNNSTGPDPYGVEALAVIVGRSEELYQQNTVMAMAGYIDKMRELLEINPGLSGRFPLRYTFESYSNVDLYKILAIRAREHGSVLDEGVEDLFTGDDFGILQREVEPGTLFIDKLNNARFVRDLIQASGRIAATRRARTVDDVNSLTNEEIAQVTVEDVTAAFWRLVEPKRYMLSG